MITELIAKLKGLFSNSFWFGNFLPVAIVTVFHLLLVEYAHPGSAPISEWWTASASDQLSTTTLAVIGLVILAYALGSFTSALHNILDGRMLPRSWHDRLRYKRIKDWEKENRFDIQLIGFLKEMRAKVDRGDGLGLELSPPRKNASRNAAGLHEVAQKIQLLKQQSRNHENLDGEVLQDAFGGLKSIVEKTNELNAADNKDHWVATEPVLNQIKALKKIVDPAIADSLYQTKVFSPDARREDIAATRIGDARLMLESYSKRTYDVDFQYLWPRIQMVMAADDQATKRLLDARAQVDFAVLFFGLLQTIPIFWIPKFFLMADPNGVIGVAVSSVVLMWFVYEMVVQSQIAFSGQVWAMIDKYRLSVLKDVAHQNRPKTLSEERLLWRALRVNVSAGETHDLFLKGDG